MSEQQGNPVFPWEEPGTADSGNVDSARAASGGADSGTGVTGAGSGAGGSGRDTGTPPAGERGRAAEARPPIARKEYYSISEVAELVELPAHVLRYWEAQFSVINPSKNRSGNRVYQRKEIRLILLVKYLLYEEKYTMEGAKARLERLRRGGDLAAESARTLADDTLQMLRTELDHLSGILTADAD